MTHKRKILLVAGTTASLSLRRRMLELYPYEVIGVHVGGQDVRSLPADESQWSFYAARLRSRPRPC